MPDGRAQCIENQDARISVKTRKDPRATSSPTTRGEYLYQLNTFPGPGNCEKVFGYMKEKNIKESKALKIMIEYFFETGGNLL